MCYDIKYTYKHHAINAVSSNVKREELASLFLSLSYPRLHQLCYRLFYQFYFRTYFNIMSQ